MLMKIMVEEKADKTLYLTDKTKKQFMKLMKVSGFINQNDFLRFLMSQFEGKGVSNKKDVGQ